MPRIRIVAALALAVFAVPLLVALSAVLVVLTLVAGLAALLVVELAQAFRSAVRAVTPVPVRVKVRLLRAAVRRKLAR